MDFKPQQPASPGYIDPSRLFQMVGRLSGKRRYYGTIGSGTGASTSFGDPSNFQSFLNQYQQRANALMSDV